MDTTKGNPKSIWRQHFNDYLRQVGRWWWVVVISILVAAWGTYQDIITVPLWGWFLILTIGALVGPFLAYHKMRQSYETQLVDANNTISTTDTELSKIKSQIDELNSFDLEIIFRDNDPEFMTPMNGFFVFYVHNRSPIRTVHEVRVRVTAIEALGNFGHGITSTPLIVGPHGDRSIFPRSLDGTGGDTFNLNSGEREIFEFILFDRKNNLIRVLDQRRTSGFTLSPQSSYRITIRASGQNTPPSESRFVVGINSKSERLICELDKSG